MLESKIQKECVQIAKNKGWYGIKLLSTLRKGLPDYLFIKHGKAIFVEFKTPKGELSKLQYKICSDISNHAHYYVVRNTLRMGQILTIEDSIGRQNVEQI